MIKPADIFYPDLFSVEQIFYDYLFFNRRTLLKVDDIGTAIHFMDSRFLLKQNKKAGIATNNPSQIKTKQPIYEPEIEQC